MYCLYFITQYWQPTHYRYTGAHFFWDVFSDNWEYEPAGRTFVKDIPEMLQKQQLLIFFSAELLFEPFLIYIICVHYVCA